METYRVSIGGSPWFDLTADEIIGVGEKLKAREEGEKKALVDSIDAGVYRDLGKMVDECENLK